MGLLIGENEMETEEFIGCCAASILWDFPYPMGDYSRKETKELQNEVKIYIKNTFRNNKINIIILDDIQYSLYGRLMNKYGFRLLLKTSGNDSLSIYLMVKSYKQRKRK